MKDAELIRVGSRTYFAPSGAIQTDHKTINRAKKASRDFQKAGGVLGDGRVRVALKAPKQAEAA